MLPSSRLVLTCDFHRYVRSNDPFFARTVRTAGHIVRSAYCRPAWVASTTLDASFEDGAGISNQFLTVVSIGTHKISDEFPHDFSLMTDATKKYRVAHLG